MSLGLGNSILCMSNLGSMVLISTYFGNTAMMYGGWWTENETFKRGQLSNVFRKVSQQKKKIPQTSFRSPLTRGTSVHVRAYFCVGLPSESMKIVISSRPNASRSSIIFVTDGSSSFPVGNSSLVVADSIYQVQHTNFNATFKLLFVGEWRRHRNDRKFSRWWESSLAWIRHTGSRCTKLRLLAHRVRWGQSANKQAHCQMMKSAPVEEFDASDYISMRATWTWSSWKSRFFQ